MQINKWTQLGKEIGIKCARQCFSCSAEQTTRTVRCRLHWCGTRGKLQLLVVLLLEEPSKDRSELLRSNDSSELMLSEPVATRHSAGA